MDHQLYERPKKRIRDHSLGDISKEDAPSVGVPSETKETFTGTLLEGFDRSELPGRSNFIHVK